MGSRGTGVGGRESGVGGRKKNSEVSRELGVGGERVSPSGKEDVCVSEKSADAG